MGYSPRVTKGRTLLSDFISFSKFKEPLFFSFWRRKWQPIPSILAWRIPWTEELGGLQSTGRKESDTTERLHSLHFLLF